MSSTSSRRSAGGRIPNDRLLDKIQIHCGKFVLSEEGMSHQGLLPAFVDPESLADGDCVAWFRDRQSVADEETPALLATFFLATMYHGIVPRSAPWITRQGEEDDLTIIRRWMAARKAVRNR